MHQRGHVFCNRSSHWTLRTFFWPPLSLRLPLLQDFHFLAPHTGKCCHPLQGGLSGSGRVCACKRDCGFATLFWSLSAHPNTPPNLLCTCFSPSGWTHFLLYRKDQVQARGWPSPPLLKLPHLQTVLAPPRDVVPLSKGGWQHFSLRRWKACQTREATVPGQS